MSGSEAPAGQSPALPNIALPVVVRLQVADYELFPGHDQRGLRHDFVPGVTIVLGINGIGKTTLLNVLLRLLLGPFNPQKLDPFEVGAHSHELVRWKQARRFFSSRVGDGAARALARGEFVIGKHRLTVERQLKDLTLTYLEWNTQELEPNEEEYTRAVLEASGAASRYDFDFLVRYLVFFLEQRVPLFWNERGQIETFRILLCEEALANAFREKQDEIRTKDSLYRNLRWQANRRRDELQRKIEDAAGSAAAHAKLSALNASFRDLSEENARLSREIATAAAERSELRTRLLLKKIELEEAIRANEGVQQAHLAALFPDAEEAARHVFANLLSQSGCTVCGNRSEGAKRRFEARLASGACPVCESPPAEQERVIGPLLQSSDVLQVAAAQVIRLRHEIGGLTQRERELDERVRESARTQSARQADLHNVTAQLEALNASLPATPEELKSLELRVQTDSDELDDKRAELERLYLEYEALVAQVQQRVTAVAKEVSRLFSEYAKSFLSERCYLGQSSYRDALGEGRSFEYPCFDVFMTSAVSPEIETVREHDDDVSESQREFIDLAFRMALIAAVTARGSRAMLVIETPEASLDAYFVDQAGALLRNFGRGDRSDGNVVIVSSNLATQNMVAGLLGFDGPEAQWPDADEVSRRVINLLDESRPNAALRERRDFYLRKLRETTRGRLPRDGA